MNEILPKCYVFGVESVGKTSIIQKFKENIELRDLDSSFVPITRSNGALLDVEIIEVTISQEKDIVLTLFNAFIAVYDISNRSSFDAISELLNKSQIKQKFKTFPNLIIVGNKCDLNESREVSTEEGRELAKQYKDSKFAESSTVENIRINEIFIRSSDNIAQTSERNIDTTCCFID